MSESTQCCKAAEAAIHAQRAVIDKLRWIAVGLLQDLALAQSGQGGHTPDESSVTLCAAAEACQERIACEEASLSKLLQLRQGLIADLGCGAMGGEGGRDGGDSGTL